MWPWHVKMTTQSLLRLLLLLMLMMRNVLTTVWCRFGRWSLVIKLSFCSYFEHKVSRFGQDFEVGSWSRFWRCLIRICVRTCDITLRSYFGKQNSTLGSVVPLAMFVSCFTKVLRFQLRGLLDQFQVRWRVKVFWNVPLPGGRFEQIAYLSPPLL